MALTIPLGIGLIWSATMAAFTILAVNDQPFMAALALIAGGLISIATANLAYARKEG